MICENEWALTSNLLATPLAKTPIRNGFLSLLKGKNSVFNRVGDDQTLDEDVTGLA